MYTNLIVGGGLPPGSLSYNFAAQNHVLPVQISSSNWQCSQFLPRLWHVH